MSTQSIPLILHVIYRLDVGGLENGLVNLINNLPAGRYRHAIVCLTESSKFKMRIKRNDVSIYELHKKNGKDISVYFRLWKLFRRLRPSIIHTRNLAALESGVIAAIAGVPIRIHGEHGRDIYDLYGNNAKYKKMRRICNPFIHRFIAVSKDLTNWLYSDVGIPLYKITQIYNGVDTARFQPREHDSDQHQRIPANFISEDSIIIGTVGRLEPVKDQTTLIKAFLQLIINKPSRRQWLRLVIIGDGSLRLKIEEMLVEADAMELVWMAGARNDVSEILRELDIFVLPSLGEGISNTILEAMASGLPVVATRVGGNSELIKEGLTGYLVPADDSQSLAIALTEYIDNFELRKAHGEAGRQRAQEVFSISSMMKHYQDVYDDLLTTRAYSGNI